MTDVNNNNSRHHDVYSAEELLLQKRQKTSIQPPGRCQTFRKCSIPEQIETLRQNGLHKSGRSSSAYTQPLYSVRSSTPSSSRPKESEGTDHRSDSHPWSTKRHCSILSLSSSIAWNPTRIRNMMLAVGPGTPAAVLWHSRRQLNNDSNDHDDGDNDHNRTTRRVRNFRESFVDAGQAEIDDDGGTTGNAREDVEVVQLHLDDDDDDAMEESHEEERDWEPIVQRRPRRREQQLRFKNWVPSIRHDGCINTACWLNVPWRLSSSDTATSLSSNDKEKYTPKSIDGYEIPTQIITSGDDQLIKFWDLKNSMGTMSPLEGGWDTYSPMILPSIKDVGSDDQYQSWVKQYDERKEESRIAGSVKLLATQPSLHRSNVFHVGPLGNAPGKVLSCGADGFLRMLDLESSSSTEIINPGIEVTPGITSPLVSREQFTDRMAFSFELLSQNSGLLCSERGLYHFDVRVKADQQNHHPLYQGTSSTSSSSGTSHSQACKACAVWNPRQHRSHGSYPTYVENEMDPTYIFAGGSGAYVELLDLRMLGGSSSHNVVERYCPNPFKGIEGSVSVSGIDVTHDGRELLVSYENDQIYTFKVLDSASCLDGPSAEEIAESSSIFKSDSSKSLDYHAMYGGHVNRVTFLKRTTYAGPNDEYILTGSDSGKAWIYERSTGAVTVLLNADVNACNGIVPHPTLPYFVTYGIEEDAKLWRARSTQDSPLTRALSSIQRAEYKPSHVCRDYTAVMSELMNRSDDGISLAFPDVFLSDEESDEYTNVCGHPTSLPCNSTTRYSIFGNALRCLDSELNHIKCTYYRSKINDSRMNFLEQGLLVHTEGISWKRLQSQATRLGMHVNIDAPWIFENPICIETQPQGFHQADVIPDYPSDWIIYHPLMQNDPFPEAYLALKGLHKAFPGNDVLVANNFSKKTSLSLPWLSDELQEMYTNQNTAGWDSDLPSDECTDVLKKSCASREEQKDERVNDGLKKVSIAKQQQNIRQKKKQKKKIDKKSKDLLKTEIKNKPITQLQTRSWNILQDTIEVLKEGGNEAMKLGLHYKAAQRYDKAVNYCAVALMPHVVTDKLLHHFTKASMTQGTNTGQTPRDKKARTILYSSWSPVLRLLLAIRMNLSLLMLKPEFHNAAESFRQAGLVLGIVLPFVQKPGKILAEGDLILNENEPIETYQEAKAIQSKVFFRWGNARFELCDYIDAARHYQSSLDCFHELQQASNNNDETNRSKPDPVLVRRLHEAKRLQKRKKERFDKKFKQSMADHM